jgi:hypothetical protein
MTDTSTVPRKPEDRPPGRPALVDEQLADELVGKAQVEGVELLGPDGLLSQVTKAVLERALAEEMTGHLGYDKHHPAGRGSGAALPGGITVHAPNPPVTASRRVSCPTFFIIQPNPAIPISS